MVVGRNHWRVNAFPFQSALERGDFDGAARQMNFGLYFAPAIEWLRRSQFRCG